MKTFYPVSRARNARAFTLVELLVVIAIIVALAAMVAIGSRKALLGAEKARCANYIRGVATGLASYHFEHDRPPLPDHKDTDDTILGDPDQDGQARKYSNSSVVSVLVGNGGTWEEEDGSTFDLSYLNPGGEIYINPNELTHSKEGLKEDGRLYDPWGKELIIALNSRIRTVEEAGGKSDKILYLYGTGYDDTAPRYEDFVLYSYGRDEKRGREVGQLRNFAGSDDVKSW